MQKRIEVTVKIGSDEATVSRLVAGANRWDEPDHEALKLALSIAFSGARAMVLQAPATNQQFCSSPEGDNQ